MLAREAFESSALERQARIFEQVLWDSVENRLTMGCRFPSTLGKTACHDQGLDIVTYHGKSMLAVNVTLYVDVPLERLTRTSLSPCCFYGVSQYYDPWASLCRILQ